MDSSAEGLSESQGLIQSLKDEIESIKRPSGTQTNPARSCKDLHMCRGDLKDGRLLWWLQIVVFDKWTMCICYPALLRLFKASFLSGQALIRGRLWFGFDNPWWNFASSSIFLIRFSVLQCNGKGFIFLGVIKETWKRGILENTFKLEWVVGDYRQRDYSVDWSLVLPNYHMSFRNPSYRLL